MPTSGSNQNKTEETVSDNEALRRMYRVTSEYDKSFENKIQELLELGREYLGVQAGFLTEISDGTQLITEASGDHELLQSGASCPLSKAYCRKTVQREAALTVQHAAVEGWESDTAYEKFGLESYIGAKIMIDAEVHGTLCFAGDEPRGEPFSDKEETFVELMAEWVSYELLQKRATEQIEQQRDQLAEFASIVSHDLRNPLRVADGHLELARDATQSEHLEKASTAIDRCQALVEDLLTLAQEGDRVEETTPVALDEVAEQCWATAETDAATVRVTATQPIEADKSRLRQLLENLYRNAVEHGGAEVTVSVGEMDDGFYVADDGAGIPEAAREEVFEAGYSTADEGTGFGLRIVKEVAHAHGWEVAVTESAQGGARFEVTGVERAE